VAISHRAAVPADALAIADLHARSWRATYRGSYADEYLDGPVDAERLDVWTTRLGRPAPNQFVVVCEDGNTIVGFACAYGAHDPAWGSFLDNIHSDPHRHGEGIGTRLFLAVVEWCREHHPERGLYLSVLTANVNARSFYEGFGAVDRGGTQPSNPWALKGTEIRRYAWPTLDAVSKADATRPAPG
jgi:GNAT superfamily N-acetyltransferase